MIVKIMMKMIIDEDVDQDVDQDDDQDVDQGVDQGDDEAYHLNPVNTPSVDPNKLARSLHESATRRILSLFLKRGIST